MKVIFLDIDGVLNSEESAKKGIHIDSNMVLRLKAIMEATGAKIVISSTWRIRTSIKTLEELFWATGLGHHSRKIIDVTPQPRRNDMYAGTDRGVIRGDEIAQWLKENPEVEKYIIIDDDSDFHDDQKEHFIQTTWKHGLLEEHVQEAIELLK